MASTPTSLSLSSLPDFPSFNAVPHAVLLPMICVDAGEESVFQGLKRQRYQHPRAIRLLDRHNSLSLGQEVLQKINDTGCPISSSQVVERKDSFLHGHAFRDISSKDARKFFYALASLPSEQKIFVPFYDLQDTLDALVLGQDISVDEREQLSKRVPTILTEALFAKRVAKNRDEKMALALACRYAKEARWMSAVKWFEEAKRLLLNKEEGMRREFYRGLEAYPICDREKQFGLYEESRLHRTSLSTYVDLFAFCGNISKISGVGINLFAPGMEELIDSAALSPSIKEVNIKDYFPTIRIALDGLGRFLERSTSVESISIAAQAGDGCEKEDFSPIVRGLRINASVRKLIVKDYSIGDEGVCGIADAIAANPKSKVDYLELALIDMTDIGASSLIKLVGAQPHLHVQLIEPRGVSRELQDSAGKSFGGRIRITYPST